MSPSRSTIGVALATAAVLWLAPSAAHVAPGPAVAVIVGIALLFGPGWLALRAAGSTASFSPGALPAACFVAGQLVLAVIFAVVVAAGTSLATTLPVLTVVLALLTLAAIRAQSGSTTTEPSWPTATPATLAGFTLLAVLLAASAYVLTRTGSIDRWWYLAYVRDFLEAPMLDRTEPFLGSGRVHPRFAFQPWLMTLALWARQADIDPVRLYERIAPVLVAPLSLSAQLALGWALFARPRAARVCAVCATLVLLSAGPLPVPARILEDKILAAAVVAPLLTAACLSHARGQAAARIAVGAAAVLALLHPLVYALALLVIVPWLVLAVVSGTCERARALVLTAIVTLGAAGAAALGAPTARAVQADGATLAAPDHPIVRVHLARERLVILKPPDAETASGASYVVNPRLLLHPLVLLALASIPLAWGRPARERAYLVPASTVPLLVAFVPPLASLLGAAVLPWMVYRVLWVIPYGALLTVGVDRVAGNARKAAWAWLLALACIATIPAALALRARLGPLRAALATPTRSQEGEHAELHALLAAVAALPRDSVVVAAPELAERIPAMTGRRVLSMSDRATVVFSGSRAVAEERLRTSASALAGRWDPRTDDAGHLTVPTHILLPTAADRDVAGESCGRVVARGRSAESFTLCEIAARAISVEPLDDARPQHRGPHTLALTRMLADRGQDGNVATVTCDPAPVLTPAADGVEWPRPGPWNPTPARAHCIVRLPTSNGPAMRPATLLVEPKLGRAVDELLIRVSGRLGGRSLWTAAATRRVRRGSRVELVLPDVAVDEIELLIVPSFLPFLKLVTIELTFDDAPETG